jgi:hypothetical protein
MKYRIKTDDYSLEIDMAPFKMTIKSIQGHKNCFDWGWGLCGSARYLLLG